MSFYELDRAWRASFGDVAPIADELKWRFEESWFRIHTLPNSKRYPENEPEYKEILDRHNLIVKELMGDGADYFLLTASFSMNFAEPECDSNIKRLGFQNNYWMGFAIDADERDDVERSYCHYFYDTLIWRSDSLNDLLRLVADDEVRGVMLFANKKSLLYHPYDGGGDIFLPDAGIKTLYKDKYRSWLSAHPSGL